MKPQDFLYHIRHWYHQHKRVLPWRQDPPDPYHVMVSEFMLQQTTVVTVMPYFKRFIDRFPTLQALADASLDQVYSLWQGLGYYSRAKNLHKAACQIVALPEFPRDVSSLLMLQGVGPYTSAAIAAIAFDQPVMPIDGNVMRVFSRLFLLEEIKGPTLYQKVSTLTHYFCAPTGNRDTAQALMELGALVCKPTNPQCDMCPLKQGCQAYEAGNAALYPRKAIKKSIPHQQGRVFIVYNKQGDVLLVKRPPKGLFANMYVFPTQDINQLIHVPDYAKPQYRGCVQHTFTHFKLSMDVYGVNQQQESNEDALDEGQWVSKTQLQDFAMPRLMHKAYEIFLSFNEGEVKNVM